MNLFITKTDTDNWLNRIYLTHKSPICERGVDITFGERSIGYNHPVTGDGIMAAMAEIMLADHRIKCVGFTNFNIEIMAYQPFTVAECMPTIRTAISRYMPIVWK